MIERLACKSSCRQGWESRLGCYTAISLSALEMKRLLLLSLEVLLDSRAIRFAGALLPLLFSFIDVGIGFPVAVTALYIIRNTCSRHLSGSKKTLRRLVFSLVFCIILNFATIVLIGCRVDPSPGSLNERFRSSMNLYAKQSSCKFSIDELQLELQCCGSASYSDWFHFAWQRTECGEEYIERSVPFSCCSRRTMLPCVHVEMTVEDARTVNKRGCALVLRGILLKIAIVGYTMTGLIICAQLLIIIFLMRMMKKNRKKMFPRINCTCYDSDASPLGEKADNSSSDESSCACAECCEARRRRLPTLIHQMSDSSPS